MRKKTNFLTTFGLANDERCLICVRKNTGVPKELRKCFQNKWWAHSSCEYL